MLKFALAGLIGVTALGWAVVDGGRSFTPVPTPPTIRADPGPVKHRPDGHIAGQQRPQATRISIRQTPDDTTPIDVNLNLTR